MNIEETIKIPDEADPLVNENKKKPIRFFYYKFFVWFYTFIMIMHLQLNPILFGQEILLTINNYLHSLVIYHAISIFLAGMVPLIFLHFMLVPREMYPILKSHGKVGLWGIPIHTSICVTCIPLSLYSVAGPLFYLYHRSSEASYVADMTENLLVLSYVIVYAFCHEIWLIAIVYCYNGHINIFRMCKFTSQQLNRPRDIEV